MSTFTLLQKVMVTKRNHVITLYERNGMVIQIRGMTELFLIEAKAIVARGGTLVLVHREESIAFMRERGLTERSIREIILSLEPKDLFDGPEADRDPKYAEKWTVAEFSPRYQGEKLYLKISIRHEPDLCKCLSIKLYTDRTTR